MDQPLFEAVKAGDFGTVDYLLSVRADVNQGDDQGWTPLSFAAGKGDLAMVKLLLERGADPLKVGHDNRTPFLIALAANRVDVAEYLREIEDSKNSKKAKSFRQEIKYCRAYRLKDLRKFQGWSEGRINWKIENESEKEAQWNGDFTDDTVVFLHQDFTVTASPWHNENMIFNQVSKQWCEFSSSTLGFKAPTNLDLTALNSRQS